MSTRSVIGILNEDKTVNSVYSHYDGYPEHNGYFLNYMIINLRLKKYCKH